jgi:ABC-type multidrug transport system fused ATPase/permease subunit
LLEIELFGPGNAPILLVKILIKNQFNIPALLMPHWRALTVAMIAVIGEGLVNLLEPLPLKIVLDNVLKTKPLTGWLQTMILSVAGSNRLSILKFAALSALVIAGVGAVCSYVEKYLTTICAEPCIRISKKCRWPITTRNKPAI